MSLMAPASPGKGSVSSGSWLCSASEGRVLERGAGAGRACASSGHIWGARGAFPADHAGEDWQLLSVVGP